MRYLLDTNVLSALMREPSGRIADHLTRVGVRSACTSIVVAAEVRFGIERRGSARLSEHMEGVLRRIEVLPLEKPVDAFYGRIRLALERAGQPIGANDLLIAAHALALGHTLVTDNVREFSRVPGLQVENWLRD